MKRVPVLLVCEYVEGALYSTYLGNCKILNLSNIQTLEESK